MSLDLVSPWKSLELLGTMNISTNTLELLMSAKWPCRGAMWFFGPISGLNFGRWILGGEFLDGEFFRGPLFLEKIGPKNSTQEFGSEIRASKIRLAEFGPKFGFRGCKIPCAEICPWSYVDPDVLQSGFGMMYFSSLGLAKSGKMPANFSAN